VKQVFDRGEEYGRFIHGSFGSGKSHFLTMLSLLLEGAQPAWKKFRPLFQAHGALWQGAIDHAGVAGRPACCVVRISMATPWLEERTEFFHAGWAPSSRREKHGQKVRLARCRSCRG